MPIWTELSVFPEHIIEGLRDTAQLARTFCEDWTDRLQLIKDCELAKFAGAKGETFIDLGKIKEFHELVDACEEMRQLDSAIKEGSAGWIYVHKKVLEKSVALQPFIPYLADIDFLLKEKLHLNPDNNFLLMDDEEQKKWVNRVIRDEQTSRDQDFDMKMSITEATMEYFASGESKWGNPRSYVRGMQPPAPR